MAEAKYDLLLVPTKFDKQKIYEQPWYKERLHTKYIKSLGPTDTSKFLAGRNWTFLKDGLDDFRDGLPPPVDGGIILKNHAKGLSPIIQGSSDDVSSVKQPAVRGRFSKEQICYSRVSPLQQQRRSHIDEIEYGLKQHPLALYPHLEECMPPDVFEDVVDILDPEMNMASDEEDSYEGDEELATPTTPPIQLPQVPSKTNELPKIDLNNLPNEGIEPKPKNPYRWLPRKEERDKKDKKKAAERRSSSPSQDEHIKSVTKEFCDWVESLGGESNNIEESTIMSLFASGYETKPALSVPIHVVELTNVPPELRMSANVPQQTSQDAPKNIPAKEQTKKDWTYSGQYQPSWVKFKYGAWYLDPKSWKKRNNDEPLRDPQELKNLEMSEAKKKSNNLDGELAPMHGAKAFMDFIDGKNTRRPEFLNRVREIQQEQAELELARLEAELQAKKKAEAKKAAQAPGSATTKA